MPTSQTPSLLTEILAGEEIPLRTIAYFRTKLRYALHDLVLREFLQQEDSHRINKAELARRIHKKPEQVSRWLGAPGNWTIDSVSDLLVGMGAELDVAVFHLADYPSAPPAVVTKARLGEQPERTDRDSPTEPEALRVKTTFQSEKQSPIARAAA